MTKRGCRAVAQVMLAVLCLGMAVSALAGEAKELFAAFLEKPGKESYLKVFAAVTSDKSYDPYSTDLDDAWDLVKEKKFREALEKLDKGMPNLLLSPRAHRFAAMAAHSLGNDDRAKVEFDIADKCAQGMLATGDGSADKPYLATRVSDEYDLLRHLKKMRKTQGLKHKDGKAFDVMQCADGTEVWFDITVVFGSLSNKLKGT